MKAVWGTGLPPFSSTNHLWAKTEECDQDLWTSFKKGGVRVGKRLGREKSRNFHQIWVWKDILPYWERKSSWSRGMDGREHYFSRVTHSLAVSVCGSYFILIDFKILLPSCLQHHSQTPVVYSWHKSSLCCVKPTCTAGPTVLLSSKV